MGMETLALNIDRIEKALEDAGFTTEYVATDDHTLYRIEGRGATIEVFDAVSGGLWKPDHTSEALLYTESDEWREVTEDFGAITSEFGVIALVRGMFATV